MNGGDLTALQLIANVGQVALHDPRLSLTQRLALQPTLERLFDAGALIIHPPGHVYSLSADGRAKLAAAVVVAAPAQEQAA